MIRVDIHTQIGSNIERENYTFRYRPETSVGKILAMRSVENATLKKVNHIIPKRQQPVDE
jgi:hypothetical protein